MGEKLKQLREGYLLTQVQLANSLNISQAHLSNLESNKRVPSLGLLKIISKALNTKIEDLL